MSFGPLYRAPSFGGSRVLVMGNEKDDAYRKRHFELCRAVNLTSLSVQLEAMEREGTPPETTRQFKAMAEVLLGLMITENNRNYGR